MCKVIAFPKRLPFMEAQNLFVHHSILPFNRDFANSSLLFKNNHMLAFDANASLCVTAIICYNPKSESRIEPLAKAYEILFKYMSPDTPVGIVKQAGREGEKVIITTLKDLLAAEIDMITTIIVGNSTTKVINGRMVTARGYALLG